MPAWGSSTLLRMHPAALAFDSQSVHASPPNKPIQLTAPSASHPIHPGLSMACVSRPLEALESGGS